MAAVVAADADAAAETNWKYKVTPDWGDLITWTNDEKKFLTYSNRPT